jgi:4-aminobutyrate aminotransferase-like enzyme
MPDRERLAQLRLVEARTTSEPLQAGLPVVWARAAGTSVWDLAGREYLDLTSGAGVASVGHSHPAVVAAVTSQAQELLHTGWQFASEQRLSLLGRLKELLPAHLDSFVLTVTGTEAVEAALKLVTAATGRRSVISFQGGYHGKTAGSLRVTARSTFRRGVVDRSAETGRLIYPDCAHCPLELRYPDCQMRCAAVTERLLDHPDFDWGDVAAVIAEPVLGAGGMVVPPPEFLPWLRRLCDQHGVLLVLDEIYTGFGRTGQMFGFEHGHVRPDVVVMGKALGGGLPIAMVAAPRELTEAMPPLLQTSTFSGSPVACAAGHAVLDVLAKEDLAANAAARGQQLLRLLAAAADRWPAVLDVRGLGLMVGIELHPADPGRGARACAEVVSGCARRGVLVAGGGLRGNVVKVTPPLTISAGECDKSFEVLSASLEEALG